MTDKEIIQRLNEKVANELNEYKADLLQKSPKIILNESYKTAILEEIQIYIKDLEMLTTRQADVLQHLYYKDNTLMYLYRQYIDIDITDIHHEITRLFEILYGDIRFKNFLSPKIHKELDYTKPVVKKRPSNKKYKSLPAQPHTVKKNQRQKRKHKTYMELESNR